MTSLLRIRDIVALAPILQNVQASSITDVEMLKLAKKWRMKNKTALAESVGYDNVTIALIKQVNALPEAYPDVTMDEMIALLPLVYANRDEYKVAQWNIFCDELKKPTMSYDCAVAHLHLWLITKGLLCSPPATRVLDRLFEGMVERVNNYNDDCNYYLRQFNVIYSNYERLPTVKQWTSVFEFNCAIRDLFSRWESITVVDGAGLRFGPDTVLHLGLTGTILDEFVKFGNKLKI